MKEITNKNTSISEVGLESFTVSFSSPALNCVYICFRYKFMKTVALLNITNVSIECMYICGYILHNLINPTNWCKIYYRPYQDGQLQTFIHTTYKIHLKFALTMHIRHTIFFKKPLTVPFLLYYTNHGYSSWFFFLVTFLSTFPLFTF